MILPLLAACTPDPAKGQGDKPDERGKEVSTAPAVDPAPAPAPEPEPAPEPAPEPEAEPPKLSVSTGDCNETQQAISKQADERAAPYSILAHLEKNFPNMKISWLLKDSAYQKYIVDAKAEKFGRCNETACYQFAAPTEVIEQALETAQTAEGHDAAVLGQALGLPAANMEGPMRLITIDLAATKTCVRLPVDEDPGVWKCQSEDDKDCFKFGGYTSGGVPELMALDVPVAAATIREVK